MITARHTAVLEHPVDRVWSLIRDFNNYPAYIEGVSESLIEDARRGDEVGAVRRFCYRGLWVRQRLVRHCDDARLFTYAGLERFPFPGGNGVAPAGYQGTIRLEPIAGGGRTVIDWSVDLDTAPGEEEPWHTLFTAWIPEWTESLRRALAHA